MNDSVVVTGIGIVTSIGIGREAFWNSLRSDNLGIRPRVLETEDGQVTIWLGALPEFDPQQHLPKDLPPRRRLNLRYASRSTVMLSVATSLAIKDSGLALEDLSSDRLGMVVGTAFGSLQTMLDFNTDARQRGTGSANSQLFPYTVSNAPAGDAAIVFGISGLNMTLSTGFSSGLEALREATESVVDGKVDVAVAGGYDELCIGWCVRWLHEKMLAIQSDIDQRPSVPFDTQRYGFYPGEGAVIFMLERYSNALERRATIYGELAAWGYAVPEMSKSEPTVQAKIMSMQRALESAGIDFADLSRICSSANGSPDGDRCEAEALAYLAKKANCCPPVTALKGRIGECAAAAGPAGVAMALLAFHNQYMPGLPNFSEIENSVPLSIQSVGTVLDEGKFVLVNSFGLDGAGSSIVVRACPDGGEAQC